MSSKSTDVRDKWLLYIFWLQAESTDNIPIFCSMVHVKLQRILKDIEGGSDITELKMNHLPSRINLTEFWERGNFSESCDFGLQAHFRTWKSVSLDPVVPFASGQRKHLQNY